MAVRQVYFTEDQEALLVSLGISNLSAYVREKMEADARDRVTMAGRADELARKREEVRVLEAAFEARAVAQEEILQLTEEGAAHVRRIAVDTGASFATWTSRWITNHPEGRRLRELLPPSFDDRAIADVLAKWPDSRPDLVRVLSEVGP